MDLITDGLRDGRKLRCLAIVDDRTRECLAIEVDSSLAGKRVIAVPDRLLDGRSATVSITVNHGHEFEGQALDVWACKHDLRLAFIRPSKTIENAYIESFNSRFRDECLNEHGFVTMDHARRAIEKWHEEYNAKRPHSSLADLTPNEYARQLAGTLGTGYLQPRTRLRTGLNREPGQTGSGWLRNRLNAVP